MAVGSGAIGLVLLAALGLGGFVYLRLWQSLPHLAGTLTVKGISAPVEVARDAAGVPAIEAANRDDAAFALGFLHAQERLFQMDLNRHGAAGTLAALLGEPAVELDRMIRVHQLDAVARAALQRLNERERAVLDAYTDGVNAGIGQLAAPPLEYAILGAEPLAWRPKDSLLVILTFYLLLQDRQGDQEYHRYLLYDALPAPLADFVAARGTQAWDAPLRGGPIATAGIPGPEVVRGHDLPPGDRIESLTPRPANGSNSWGVGGRLTAHGGALVANDMHMAFGVPNTFYRADVSFADADGRRWRVGGLSVPGLPFVIAGSNGRIAWTLTNSAADWIDLVRLEEEGLSAGRVRTSGGESEIRTVDEVIEVAGAAPERIAVEVTPWGPVIRETTHGVRFAQRWVAHHPEATNLGMLRMETAVSVDEALALAPRIGIPAQNLLVGDADGRLGWTIVGLIPRRQGHEANLPGPSSDGGHRWSGWLAPKDYPRIVDTLDERLWTANARTVNGADLRKLGHGYYMLGARAQQIRDALFALERTDVEAMRRLQLDHRAVFLERWRRLLLETLDAAAPSHESDRARLRELVAAWDGRANAESAGYRLVRAFRERVDALVFAPIVAAVRQRHPDFDLVSVGDQREGPLWALVSARPAHLLPRPYADWQTVLLAAADDVVRTGTVDGGRLDAQTWGEVNRLSMRHPLSGALPLMAWLFDMPAEPLDGDLRMPLAQTEWHGPVVRFVVSPGREDDGIMQMAGGQAGNPLSPYYGAGHDRWLSGTGGSFRPGPAEYRLQLVPAAAAGQD